jgi:hypothetical protein
MDMNKMDRIKVDDLKLREESRRPAGAPGRSARRSTKGMPELERRSQVRPRRVLRQGPRADHVGPGPRGVRPREGGRSPAVRDRYGRNTFGQCCLLARRLVEAGTRVVEVIWPKVANSDNHSWDVHVGLSKRMKNQAAPMLDAGLSALIEDLDERGLLDETLVVAVGEFGRSPQRGVSAPAATATATTAATTGRTATPASSPAPASSAATSTARATRPASAPLENPVHPTDCWRRSTTPSASTRRRSSTTT